MIFYIKHYEQLCNRIWAILPALSFALHYNKKLVVLWAFKPYIELFPNLQQCRNVVFLFSKNIFQYRRLIRRVWKLYDCFLLQKKSFRNIHPANPLIFSGAWECRLDESYILEEKKRIVSLFIPSQEVVDEVDKRMQKDSFVYVGVHIRRGDYARFSCGRYFYDISYYYRLMDCIYKQLIDRNCKVKFVICSNEKFDIKEKSLLQNVHFAAEELIRFEDSAPIVDLYALSRCDYIFGPPSTFSQWASFFGEAKLFFVKSASLRDITLDEFRAVKLLDRFYE